MLCIYFLFTACVLSQHYMCLTYTIPTIHTIHTIHTKHTKHTIPNRHTYHTYHPYSITPPQHHRGGGGQYHTPATPHGAGGGRVLWLTHDHGRGGGGLEHWTIYRHILLIYPQFDIHRNKPPATSITYARTSTHSSNRSVWSCSRGCQRRPPPCWPRRTSCAAETTGVGERREII